jgi:hypothetical protein
MLDRRRCDHLPDSRSLPRRVPQGAHRNTTGPINPTSPASPEPLPSHVPAVTEARLRVARELLAQAKRLESVHEWEQAIALLTRAPSAPKADPAMAASHPLHILLAEDNAVNRKLALRLPG